MKAWHEMNFDAVTEELKTSAENGLSRKEASARLAKDGKNNIFKAQRGDLSFYLKRIASAPLCLLMLFSAIITYIFDKRSTAILLMGFVLCSMFIVFAVYVRARRILENMEEYSLPRAKVYRDGRIYEISQSYVVRGDLIMLSKGDIVPCDARIVSCDGLVVRETGITGAGVVRDKDPGFTAPEGCESDKCRNMLFAASVIEEGRACAICSETGEQTLVARTRSKRKRASFEGLRTMIMLRRFSGTLTAALLLAVFSLTVYCMLPLYSGALLDGYLTVLAFAAGCMSELYTVLGCIMVAGGIYGTLGADKKDRGAVMKNPSAADRLADTDTLIIPIEALYDESELSLETVYVEDDDYKPEKDKDAVKDILELAALAGGVYGTSRLAMSGPKSVLSYEEEEILRALGSMGVMQGELSEKYKLTSHKKVNEEGGELDISLAQTQDGSVVGVKGDIDKVLSICKYKRRRGEIVPLDDSEREKLSSLAYTLCEGGHRIRAVASRRTVVKRFGMQSSQMVFEGILSFKLKLLPSALEDAAKCSRSGVSVIVLAPEREEALGIMKALGIFSERSLALSAQRLSMMSDEILRTDIELYNLCYGLSGKEKLRVIKALRANKRVVTFVGGELSDIVLMKSADSCVTFGSTLSGKNQERIHYKAGARDACDAMRFCADVIVSPVKRDKGGFSSVVKVIERARNIHASIFRMLRYLMSVNVARSVAIIFSLITGIKLMSAESILFLGLIIDLAAVFSIVFEMPAPLYSSKVSRDEIRHPVSSSLRSVVIGLVGGLVSVITVLVFQRSLPGASFMTAVFMQMLFSVPAVLFESTREDSVFTEGLGFSLAYILVVFLTVVSMLLLFFTPFGNMLSVSSPSLPVLIATVMAVTVVIAVSEIMKLLR